VRARRILQLKKDNRGNTISKTNLTDLKFKDLNGFILGLGEKPFRAKQIYRWLHMKGASSFDDMTDLSKDMRACLSEVCEVSHPRLVEKVPAADGTAKLCFELNDGNIIESVLIPAEGHLTLCVSTQVGCRMNCSFCYTATLGYTRNLSAGEITGQYHAAARALAGSDQIISNVVLMGMGEPLDNYDNVITALDNLMSEDSVNLSSRRVVLSTSGLVPEIQRLMLDSQVSLSVSLNATTDDVRSRLMPINKKYPIRDLLNALDQFPKQRRKRIVLEYVLIKGVNDTFHDAGRLAKMALRLNCKVNLIPFNSHDRSRYKAPDRETTESFQKTLLDAGITALMRQARGQNIHAACGMLGKSLGADED